jgi:hypothetical protein
MWFEVVFIHFAEGKNCYRAEEIMNAGFVPSLEKPEAKERI